MGKPDVLMTYNVNYGRKVPEIIEWLGSISIDRRPNIACFQEMPDPYVHHFAGKLEQIGYSLSFASAIEKHGEIFGQLTAVGLGGKITRTDTVDFGFNKWERIYPGIKGRSGRRAALVTDVQFGDRLHQIVNIHQPLIASDSERFNNILQVEKSLTPDIPAIIAGDQNSTGFLRIIHKGWLRDQMAELGFRDSGNKEPTFGWGGIRWIVDYVAARDCKLKNPRVERIGLSDHEPMFVEIH